LFVISIPFIKHHKNMLAHTKVLSEYQNGQMSIHPSFTKLITTMAVKKLERVLAEDDTSHSDCLDMFRFKAHVLALRISIRNKDNSQKGLLTHHSVLIDYCHMQLM
jgi:hypothetical protein